MSQDFHFFKTTMPETRKADYYLGYFDGCVYLDFNRSTDDLITLRRISFDGYGCCNINQTANHLNKEDSLQFIKAIKQKELDQIVITALVKKMIRINKAHIWTDALEQYFLIEKA